MTFDVGNTPDHHYILWTDQEGFAVWEAITNPVFPLGMYVSIMGNDDPSFRINNNWIFVA